MDPAVIAPLRAWALDAIGRGLETVAMNWARLNLDRLPLHGSSLATLQLEYQDLWEALPDCSPVEVERLLQAYARGMRLSDERVTATQGRYLRTQLGLTERSAGPEPLRFKPPDDTWEWLQPVFRCPGSLVDSTTMPSALFIISQRSLGARFPTFTEAFRDELCKPEVQHALVDPGRHVRLHPLIEVHSRWIARVTTRDEVMGSVSQCPASGERLWEGVRVC